MTGKSFPEISKKAQLASILGQEITGLVKPLCGDQVKEIMVVFAASVNGTTEHVVGIIKPGIEEFIVRGL